MNQNYSHTITSRSPLTKKGGLLLLTILFVYFLIHVVGYFQPYSTIPLLIVCLLFCCYFILITQITVKTHLLVYLFLFLTVSGGSQFTLAPNGSLWREITGISMPFSSIYYTFEFINISLILFAIISRSQVFSSIRLQRLCILIFSFIAVSLVSTFAILNVYNFKIVDLDIGTNFVGHGSDVSWYRDTFSIQIAIVFYIACRCFIKTLNQAEFILKIFFALGIVLLLEYLILLLDNNILDLSIYQFTENNRFNSLFLGNYLKVGMVSTIAVISGFYFITKYRKFYLLPFIFLLIIPGFGTYQRSFLLTLVVGTVVYFVFTIKHPKNLFILMGLIGVPIIILLLITVDIGGTLGGDVRVDYWSNSSFFDRIGTYLRGIDVFIYTFPVGAGGGPINDIMGSKDILKFMSWLNPDTYSKFYFAIASNTRSTSPHSVYIELLAQFGIVGLFIFIVILVEIYRQFKRIIFLRSHMSRSDPVYLINVFGISLSIALFFYSLVQVADQSTFLIIASFFFLGRFAEYRRVRK